LQVIVGGQASNVLTFLKPVPSFTTATQPRQYTGMHTVGGEDFSVVGIANIGVEPMNITIGGRRCVPKVPDRAIDNGLTGSLATYTLSCTTPAGVGANLPIVITTIGGSSRVNDDFLFTYAPPVLYASPVVQRVGFNGSMPGCCVGDTVVPTVGASVSFPGLELGGFSLASSVSAYLDEVIKRELNLCGDSDCPHRTQSALFAHSAEYCFDRHELHAKRRRIRDSAR
jgi:hypothetical protein